jgi:hypothetical protein
MRKLFWCLADMRNLEEEMDSKKTPSVDKELSYISS